MDATKQPGQREPRPIMRFQEQTNEHIDQYNDYNWLKHTYLVCLHT